MSETKDKIADFEFLSDNPVSEDFFGCHNRTAMCIGDKIESDKIGKTIGIEGSWGSGKSSIIKMLENRWKKNEDLKVFSYDAWTHQGDPLRRSFLEELITFLQRDTGNQNSWINKHECKNAKPEKCLDCDNRETKCRPDIIRNELRLRFERNVVNSEPVIKGWGLLFSIFTLMLPVGVAVFSAAKNLTDKYFVIGILLMSLPFLLIVTYFLTRWYKGDKGPILGDIFGKTKDTTKHTTQKTPEPTSIEFQEYYYELLKLALEKNKRKLVIVVDNLDRVEPDTALSVWGTMRTFLEKSNSLIYDFINRIWVIVPYDPSSLSHLWKRDGIMLSREFSEKTFQVKYQVPLPITSCWEDYFKSNLKKAIKNIDTYTQNNIFYIYRLKAIDAYKHRFQTPREIKIFINRIVALAQVHSCNTALEDIALYATIEISEKDKLEDIANSNFDNIKLLTSVVGDDYREALASIYFAKPKEEAREILYDPNIRDALQKGDSNQLTKLLEEHYANRCIERYIQENSNSMNLQALINASKAFTGIDVQNDEYLKNSLQHLSNRISKTEKESWGLDGCLDESNADDVIRIINDVNACKQIQEKLSLTYAESELGEPPAIKDVVHKIDIWTKAALKILQHIIEIDVEKAYLKLELPDYDTYKKILDMVVSNKKGQMVKYFGLSISDEKEYIQKYLNNIKKGNVSKDDRQIYNGFLRMKGINEKYKKNFIDSLSNAFQTELNPNTLTASLELVYSNITEDDYKSILKNKCKNGRMFKFLQDYHGNRNIAAFIITTILLFEPDSKLEPETIQQDGQTQYKAFLEEDNEQKPDDIAAYILKYKILDKFFISVEQSEIKNKKAIELIIKAIQTKDVDRKHLNSELFFKHHNLILHHLDTGEDLEDSDYVKLFNELFEKSPAFKNELSDCPIKTEFSHAFYLSLTKKNVSKKLADNLCDRLKDNFSSDDWLEQLKDNEHYTMIDVLIELVKLGFKPDLDDKFVEALIKHAKLLQSGKVDIEPWKEDWNLLLDSLSDYQREEFRRRLLDLIIGSNKSVSPLIVIYENEIVQAISQFSKQSDFVNTTCRNIVARKDKEEIKWMIKTFHAESSIFKVAKENTINVIADATDEFIIEEYNRIQAIDHNSNDYRQEKPWLEAVEKFAQLFNISLTESKSENTNGNINNDNINGKESNKKTEG